MQKKKKNDFLFVVQPKIDSTVTVDYCPDSGFIAFHKKSLIRCIM